MDGLAVQTGACHAQAAVGVIQAERVRAQQAQRETVRAVTAAIEHVHLVILVAADDDWLPTDASLVVAGV
jgi:hypothetical protein